MVIAHFITRFGAFAVHLAMHRIPWLIWLHKKHHEFKVTEMTAGSTYLSNPWELVLMEHLTQLIGCMAVGRLPFLSLMLIMCYNSMKGAVDHSSFSINNG
jgi:sterol desaturase/sphingolipid hydroxylase (fatty acid hydroxylase superfamily)